MLFAPMRTVTERISHEQSQRYGWGGGHGLPAIDRSLVEHQYRRAMETILLDPEFVCLEEVGGANVGRYTPDRYRALAGNNQALLFEIPATYNVPISEGKVSYLPKWGLTKDGEINGVAVEVAKLFASYRAGEEAANFIRFVKNVSGEDAVTINPEKLDNKYLSELFRGLTKGAQGWTMSLEDAFKYVSDPESDNGRAIIAQVKANIDCTEQPLPWPIPENRLPPKRLVAA